MKSTIRINKIKFVVNIAVLIVITLVVSQNKTTTLKFIKAPTPIMKLSEYEETKALKEEQVVTEQIEKKLEECQVIITEQIKYYDIQASKDVENLVLYGLPDYDTSFFAYMSYRTITDNTTKQWELQQEAYTDEYGLRKVNDDYCVALGSYYSTTIGERFKVTMENGNEFTTIIADLKQDIHTDWKNQYTPVYDNYGNLHSANVIEFIVDDYKLDEMVSILGTVGYYEEFKGNILSIEKIE